MDALLGVYTGLLTNRNPIYHQGQSIIGHDGRVRPPCKSLLKETMESCCTGKTKAAASREAPLTLDSRNSTACSARARFHTCSEQHLSARCGRSRGRDRLVRQTALRDSPASVADDQFPAHFLANGAGHVPAGAEESKQELLLGEGHVNGEHSDATCDDVRSMQHDRVGQGDSCNEQSGGPPYGGLVAAAEGLVYRGPPEGDTAGAVLLVAGVTVSAGPRDLVRDASWRLMPGEKAGLVGVNGCGKSTLLRAIIGQHPFDSGSILVGYGTKLGYLEQTAVSGSQRSVWEEARSRMDAVNAADRELQLAEAAVERSEEGGIARLAAAQEAFEAVDGYKADEIIAGVLNGLGFQQSDWTRLCSEFSGGWQMRIALARLLLGQTGQSERSLLLLDEPTNHLDSKAKAWLGQYLKRSSGAAIIVSHDEALLNQACDRIGEVRGAQLHTYVGNYSKFLREREARQVALAQEIAAKQGEIDKLQGFVDRFGAKATKASAANSKKKAIAKLQAAMPTALPDASAQSGGERRMAVVKLPPPPVCAREVLQLKRAVIGWEGAEPLLHNVDIRLETGMRMVILGPNGCGKSTLMRALAGRGALISGERTEGMGAQIGVFTQDLAQDLPQDISGLDCVLEIAREKDPTLTNERARTALGTLGLMGEGALRPIRALSGGEKARVALGAFVLRPHNALLLDEASNHLDRATVKALADALSKFTGAMVLITHDREFCEAVKPTHVARVLPNGTVDVRLCINGELRPEDFDPMAAGQLAVAPAVTPATGGGGGSGAAAKGAAGSSKEDRKRLQQVQNRIKKLLAYIEKGEEACQGYDKELVAAGSDAGKAVKILKTKEEVLAKVAEFEAEWEGLEAEAEELRARLGAPAR